jgi:MFS family permease
VIDVLPSKRRDRGRTGIVLPRVVLSCTSSTTWDGLVLLDWADHPYFQFTEAVVVPASTTTTAITGWMIIGLGLGVPAPTVLAAAPDRATHTTPAPAITAVTALGYLGSFTGPPVIGGLATLIGLSAALGLLATAGVTAVWLAPLALPDGVPKQTQLHEPDAC